MWRMLQERANGSATSKPYNWSYLRHMKKKPNKTRLRNNIKLSKVITMWSPSQKRYQNGPMICVHSRALQLASCSFFAGASTMCSPSQKRHKNGPMIYVCSRALQWISCNFLEAPGQCDHQARNDTKMNQWSAFGLTHFTCQCIALI